MNTIEFLNKFDSKQQFSEDELYNLYNNNTDVEMEDIEENIGELDRWVHEENKIVKINNRYFRFYAMIGNTEYQENSYDIQPTEVIPIQKIVICWESIDNGTI